MEYLDKDGTKELITQLKNYMDTEVDPHPVGSVYFTIDPDFKPAEKWGGTWKRIANRYIMLAGDDYEPGTFGGEDSHTITIDELPAHTHTVSMSGFSSDSFSYASFGQTAASSSSSKTYKTSSAGGGKPITIIPSYFAIICWRRDE